MQDKQEDVSHYKTLDKDYGRVLIVGSGYGELDVEEYRQLEALIK